MDPLDLTAWAAYADAVREADDAAHADFLCERLRKPKPLGPDGIAEDKIRLPSTEAGLKPFFICPLTWINTDRKPTSRPVGLVWPEFYFHFVTVFLEPDNCPCSLPIYLCDERLWKDMEYTTGSFGSDKEIDVKNALVWALLSKGRQISALPPLDYDLWKELACPKR